jgi:Recombination, repair and ssDNA binding protein UvsY
MKPTDIFKIIEMWEKDSVIDQTDPSRELIRIPILHSKYVREHVLHSLASKQCAIELSKMKKLKWEYYQGRLDESELKKYGWEPFRFVLKQDISTYLESDEDLTKLNAKKSLHDQAVTACEMIIKEINSRTYQLRAFIDFERFVHGQG